MRIAQILLFALLAWVVPGQRGLCESSLRGNLQPGSYSVGFKTLFAYDYGRTYKRKYDREGNRLPGEATRPMKIMLWYPAEKKSEASSLLFEEYLMEFDSERAPETRKEEIRTRFLKSRWAQGAEEAVLQNLLKAKTGAIKDAGAAKGPHPLVLFAQDWREYSELGNTPMYEFLASHGYVVATSSSLEEPSRYWRMMMQVHDLQWIRSALHDLPFVDTDRIALIGFGWGGVAAALLGIHDPGIEAIISLDSVLANRFAFSHLFQNPLYEPSRFTAPLLHIFSKEPGRATELSFFEALNFADVYYLKLSGIRPGYFPEEGSSLGSVSSFVTNSESWAAYRNACRNSLNFLDAFIKRNSQALESLKNQPEGNGIAVLEFVDGLEPPPTSEEFIRILEQKDFQTAADIFYKIREHDPDYEIFEAYDLVVLANQNTLQGRPADALEILKLCLEAEPGYWRVYDALGNAYLAHKQLDLAVEHFRKSQELNPANQNAAEALKKILGEN